MQISDKEYLIGMWEALEHYDVVVSYPDKQPNANPANAKEKRALEEFKNTNDFFTFYQIGPYKITHREVKRMYNALVKASIMFRFNGQDIGGCLDRSRVFDKPVDKDFYDFYLAVKGKSENPDKPVENLIKRQISTNISEIKGYVQIAFDSKTAKGVIAKLNEVETVIKQPSQKQIQR